MPATPVIRDRAGVEELARQARSTGRFGLDFEFLWERTYRPIPCLAQVSIESEVTLVDPIEGALLEPLAELVADPAVETVMHAPSADLTLLALHFGTRPRCIADVQLTAGFVGLGAGQSLATLLERALQVRIEKTEGFSDWSQRPLSDAQLHYAANDVLYLLPLHDELTRRVAERRRGAWVREEHDRRYGPDARFVTEPLDAWRKIKGQGSLNSRDRAVLREVGAWRELEAQRRDRPPAWIMQDRLALDVAKRKPADQAALARVRGLTERIRAGEMRELLAAVGRGIEGPPMELGRTMRPDLAQRVSVLAALGQLIVGVRADAAELAAPLLATRDEIEAFLAACIQGNGDDYPLADGWRRELAGEALERLAAGRLALTPTPTPPYLEEIERRP
jgi:ribonuclease D